MKAIIAITACLLCLFTNAQDTVKPGPSIIYSGKEYPHRGKDFASGVKYALEVITWSPTHRKFEYCYYYDTARIGGGDEYRVLNDSIITVNNVVWQYTKKDSLYFISRQSGQATQSGLVRSIIPFDHVTPLYMISNTDNDTLWYTDYWLDARKGIPYETVRLPQNRKTGKLYSLKEADSPPSFATTTLEEGLSCLPVHEDDEGYCYGEPYTGMVYLTCTITKDGRIINLFDGSGKNLPYCDYIIKHYARNFNRITIPNPAKIKGKPVDVKVGLRLRRYASDY